MTIQTVDHLVLTLHCDSNLNHMQTVYDEIAKSECLIIDCQANRYAEISTMNFLLQGHWNNLAKLETHLASLETKLQINYFMQRVSNELDLPKTYPYSFYIIAPNSPGIMKNLLDFFKHETVTIRNIHAENYVTKHSDQDMLAITMEASLESTQHIADFRERFIIFCDNHNYDGILEPTK